MRGDQAVFLSRSRYSRFFKCALLYRVILRQNNKPAPSLFRKWQVRGISPRPPNRYPTLPSGKTLGGAGTPNSPSP